MKKDLRVIKTKKNLQTALLTLLEEKPLEKISIAELCREANVNRGTFYLHFQDVPELFEMYFQEITIDLKKAYYEPFHLTNNHISHLEPHMVRIFHHVKTFDTFYSIVFNRKAPLMYYYNLFDIIRVYLKGSIEENIQSADDLHSEYTASYQANAILGMVIEWVSRGFQETPEYLSEQLLRMNKNIR